MSRDRSHVYEPAFVNEGERVRVTIITWEYHNALEVGHWEGWYWHSTRSKLISRARARGLRWLEGKRIGALFYRLLGLRT